MRVNLGGVRWMGVDFFFFSSRRRHTRYWRDWSSDVCSSDLVPSKQVSTAAVPGEKPPVQPVTVATGEPSAASMSARSGAGRSGFGRRGLPAGVMTELSAGGASRAIASPARVPWDDGGTVTTPASTDPALIRNFCIIAHIDHGKSTLADRMLEVTGIIEARQMRAQYLDRMDIERERGITIKAQNVRLPWRVGDTEYVRDMIDTPGHVDFTYEVSRSLAACEGAVLLVDAAQGIEAQTLANLYLALENDLTIIPVLNKIDLPAAQPEKYAAEIAHIIGCDPSDVLRVSGKTGEGVPELLNEIVAQIPAPVGDAEAPARAMIFDSVYDIYRGVITYVRVVDGRISSRERIKMMSTGAVHELLEIGVISPEPKPVDGLGVGEVGYFITGVKDVDRKSVV